MKKSEREFMRWVDGEGDRPTGAHDEDHLAVEALRELLKKSAPRSSDPGPRFNAQILSRLREEAAVATHTGIDFLPRLAWTGALLLLVAALWTLLVVPSSRDVFAGREYFADVTRTNVAPGHRVSAVPIEEKWGTRLTVVWIDGLEYLPEGRLRR